MEQPQSNTSRWARPLPDRLSRQTLKTDSCWLWTGRPGTNRYGVLRVTRNGKRVEKYPSSLALEAALGRSLAPDEYACHTCDVRLCVRNDEPGEYIVDGVSYVRFGHLWLGNHAANLRDMVLKGRPRKKYGVKI